MPVIYRTIVLSSLLVSAALSQVTGLAGWNIFLDPGHSQSENMGIYGYSEAERNLRVALRLKEVLLQETDIDTVFLSRTDDRQVVSLAQRTSLANSLGAAWYHSIHSNAGAPAENSTLLLWGQYYNGSEKVPTGGRAMSDIMADILTRGMRTTTIGSIGDCSFYTGSDWCRQTGGPYLHVNRESTMPSELSESGYHTNPRQNLLFMSDSWKILEAKTFYWSILKFFHLERPRQGIVSGEIFDIETGLPANGVVVTANGQKDTTDTYESLFYKYSSDPKLLHNGFYYLEHLPPEKLPMFFTSNSYYSDTLVITPCDTFFTFQNVRLINKMPPHVLTTIPAAGDSNVAPWQNITIEFSRKMNRQTTQNNIAIRPEVAATFLWSSADTKVVIKTDSLSPLTDYSIIISAAASDRYNHPFDGNGDGIGGDDFVLNFRTGSSDRTPPVLVHFYPAQSQKNVEVPFIINLVFDEKIDPITISDNRFKLKCVATGYMIKGEFFHYLLKNKSLICFFPTDEILTKSNYAARLFPGVKDIFGNETDNYANFSFSTTDKSYQPTVIDSFETNLTDNWWEPIVSAQTTGIVADSTFRLPDENVVNFLSGSSKSMQLTYSWEPQANEWFIRLYLEKGSAKEIYFDNNYLLQAYIFGDGSGNKIRFCVDDDLPEISPYHHEVSSWYTIDWFGWKLVSWDMGTDSIGNWLGDGNLDGLLRFDSFQLTHDFAAAQAGTLYFDDLQIVKEIPSAVEKSETNLLENFALKQNYPNPFNPETTIEFCVPTESLIKIVVYDVLGHQIKKLIEKKYQPGFFQVSWDGRNSENQTVASGLYLCNMEATGFNQVRKMLLLQ